MNTTPSSNPPATTLNAVAGPTRTASPRTKPGLGSQPGKGPVLPGGGAQPAQPERRRLGRYEICFELASGGMGSLYLATFRGPAGFEKVVALKQIHKHLAKQEELVEMFLDEARLASQIGHANVCSVFDFGEADGNYFLAMEYLMGEPLSRIRTTAKREGWITKPNYPTLVAKLMSDACEGLHAAHELKDPQGRHLSVVHRDISPVNLFVTYDGVVKVLDFGVASASQRLQQTTTGQLKGKFSYMAPEQLKGERADRRADIWALGVTTWELLTGERLFRADTEATTMFRIVADPIPRPSAIRPSLPEELDEIVMKAVERSLGDRYQTAREFGRALTRFVARAEEPVGLAEVSEWLDRLFPEGRGRRRQLVELALKAADSEIPSVDSPDSSTSIPVIHTLTDTNMTARLVARLFPVAKRRRTLAAAAIAALVGGVLALTVPFRDETETPDSEDAVAASAPPAEVEGANTNEEGAESSPPEPEATGPSGLDPSVSPPAAADPPPEPTPPAAEVRPEPATRTRRSETRERRRRKAAASKAEAVTGSGVVNVVTPNGWALVSVEGRDLGETPVRVRLPAGPHLFLVRPFGQGPPIRRTMTVEPDTTERLVVPLSP